MAEHDQCGIGGLPLSLEDCGQLRFSPPLGEVQPDLRRTVDMAEVLLDREQDGPEPLYYMYRGVMLDEHEPLFRRAGIRHDITVISPGRVGREYVKTAGHYHSVSPSGVSYPEIYQVIKGQALYLLQAPAPTHDEVVVRGVRAGPGDVVVVPPDFGHVTVNVGTMWLVMANLVEGTAPSRYEPYRALRGAAAFVVDSGDGPQLWLNSRYRAWHSVTIVDAARWVDMGLSGHGPIYRQFIDRPTGFEMLVRPERAPTGKTA